MPDLWHSLQLDFSRGADVGSFQLALLKMDFSRGADVYCLLFLLNLDDLHLHPPNLEIHLVPNDFKIMPPRTAGYYLPFLSPGAC